MDVFLTKEVLTTLAFLWELDSLSNSEGVAIGHKRGHRIIVEKVIPLKKVSYPSITEYLKLDKLLNNKLVGFFTFERKAEKCLDNLLIPYNLGNILLRIEKIPEKIKAFLIDYQQSQILFSPLGLKLPE
ncbi:MAG: hypothetical protein ACE5WD_12835 [Candidatus Aminicenantia bacterium]